MTLNTLAGPTNRAWASLAAAWLLAAALLAFWLLGTSTGALREQLKVWQFWSLETCVFLGAICAVYVWREIAAHLERRDVVRLAIVAGTAALLTTTLPPRTNRIFYDEQIYQSIGRNLADLRLAQVCNDGRVESGRLECASGEYNKQPYAYPHLLGLFYSVFGVHDSTAFVVNVLANVLTTAGIYLLVWLLFSDRDAATFGALTFALIPQQLAWSATAAVEPTASAAIVLVLVLAAHAARSTTTASLVALAIAAAYAVQFRPESILALPVVAMIAWPRVVAEARRPRLWWCALLSAVLLAVHAGHLVAVRDVPWGSSGPRFSIAYLPGNLAVNGWFYLFDERFPFLFSALALVGTVVRKPHGDRLAIAGLFLLFFVVDLLFYAGSYNYGADVRYSLLTYPSLAVLAGVGASWLATMLARWSSAATARIQVLILLTFCFLFYAPGVRAMPEEAWAARADVRFAETAARELPAGAYVLTHNPGMFHLWGVNAGQMSRVAGNLPLARYLAEKYPGGLFVHWNFWCNVQDPVQPEFCRSALALGSSAVVRSHRERDQEYALYRLTLPEP